MNFTLPTVTPEFLKAAGPTLILCFVSIISLLQSVFKPLGGEKAVRSVLIAGLIASLLSVLGSMNGGDTSFLDGALIAGAFPSLGQVLILVLAIVATGLFAVTGLGQSFFRGEISSLFAMIVAGMLLLVTSEEMVTLFVGLELSSIGLYALVGYINPNRRSQEGAIKYFVLGSFAAALLLFGFGLLYAATGSMRLSEIVEIVPKLATHGWVQLGVLFSVAGIGFKLALVPFHLWAPDVYEAAPTGIAGFMATSVKVVMLFLAVRLFGKSLGATHEVWLPTLMFLAILSMIVGNIMALVQANLKRMLAYSSIAHSGYMVIAICAVSGASGEFPVAALLFYIFGYIVVSMGAFGLLMWLEGDRLDNLTLDDLKGLSKEHPWIAFGLTVFLLSFAGMPPTVGFIGKLFVFKAAIDAQLYTLVLIGIVGSAISLFYYLRVVVNMYMLPRPDTCLALKGRERSVVGSVLLALGLVLAFLMGTVLPGPAFKFLTSVSQDMVAN